MRKSKRKLHINKKVIAILAIFLSVGFAYITSAVNIGGVFTVFSSTYDVHFENLQVTEGSVEANTPIIDSENTEVSATVKFNNPGDYYEFTVDAVNAGDIDAMINTVSDIELTENQEKYIDYTVTYADGEEPIKYHQLNSGDRCTFKVKASFKEDIETEDLPVDGDNVEVVLDTNYVKADSNRIKRRAEYSLYNVLKDEANSGGLAKKYTGAHQDSMDASKSTKDIYHWYAANDADGNTIKNKNNVIFANHCWQLIRTTDTGGARLLYNGEVENNQCLDTRGAHVGYNGYSYKNLNNSYYYGTDYTYDKANNVFSISGDIEQATWSDSTFEDLIGKYTCMKTTQNETCSEIYLIESYNSNEVANVININSSSHYSQFGRLRYNKSEKSVAYLGYMYNKVYEYEDKPVSFMSYINEMPGGTVSSDYWYADSIEINGYNYKLVNPYKINTNEELSSLEQKYTFYSSDSEYSSNTVFYITAVSNTFIGTSYHIRMHNGHDLSYYNDKFTYGSSYTDNGNGTYTINNPSDTYAADYYYNRTNLRGKYVCKNTNNNTCTELFYFRTDGIYGPSYYTSSNTYKMSNSFTYNNGIYTLDNNGGLFWNFDNVSNLNNYHYTCFNKSGTCEKIYYVYSIMDLLGIYARYITIENGKGISQALNEMISDNNINTFSSISKKGIDSWYKNKLISYSSYIEDSIYCGERIINDYYGWDPQNLINSTHILKFKTTSDTIKCTNITDSYSTNNNIAKLEYPVAHISTKDTQLIDYKGDVFATDQYYWLMTPSGINGTGLYMIAITSSGRINENHIDSEYGIRPYISLSPSTFYTSGDGSMENPYVVFTE